jgi:hypothetical protein
VECQLSGIEELSEIPLDHRGRHAGGASLEVVEPQRNRVPEAGELMHEADDRRMPATTAPEWWNHGGNAQLVQTIDRLA